MTQPLIVALTLFAAATQVCAAPVTGVTFAFTENANGQVTMRASGSLNTASLAVATVSNWGSAGVCNCDVSYAMDIMGDTLAGAVSQAFRFNDGTDTSAWSSAMFLQSLYQWSGSGTTQFTTYVSYNGKRIPGIAVGSEDLVGGIWTPNNVWSRMGTFASLGLTPGSYTVTDSVSGQFITIQIGAAAAAVPEPGTFAIAGLGLLAAGLVRRRTTAA